MKSYSINLSVDEPTALISRTIKKKIYKNWGMKAIIGFCLLLLGCAPMYEAQNDDWIVREDMLYKTRKYLGYVKKIECVEIRHGVPYNLVETDSMSFHICGKLLIPVNAWCFLKREDFHFPGSVDFSWKYYFTWNGTNSLYSIE